MNRSGCLIVNADDWGLDLKTTDRTLDCIKRGAVTSVSAMVFMSDSERAAGISRENGIDTGLHLNLTAAFTSRNAPQTLSKHQARICAYLRSHRLAQVLFHPGLVDSFRIVVSAQLEEYARLYGTEADRIDGHHHMHLSANVLFQRLLPEGTVVRRNFSFSAGEKNLVNRTYRQWIDLRLKRRHRLVDHLFAFNPAKRASQSEKLLALTHSSIVELETHPADSREYDVLMRGLPFDTVAPPRRFKDVSFA